jgi:hypothetical protein
MTGSSVPNDGPRWCRSSRLSGAAFDRHGLASAPQADSVVMTRHGSRRATELPVSDVYRHPFSLDPELRFESPLLADLHGYWLDERGNRAMPWRTDIDPLDPELRLHLRFAALTDVVDLNRFRFSLIESPLTEIVGRDSTGKHPTKSMRRRILST